MIPRRPGLDDTPEDAGEGSPADFSESHRAPLPLPVPDPAQFTLPALPRRARWGEGRPLGLPMPPLRHMPFVVPPRLVPSPRTRPDEAITVKTAGPTPVSAPAPAEAAPARQARIDPIWGTILLLAFSLGTFPLPVEVRYTVLWTMLILLGVSISILDSKAPLGAPRSLSLGWGVGVGFIIGLPLLITTARGLAQVSTALFPYSSASALFQALVFVGPLGETLFFRGVLQDERGLLTGIVSAGLFSVAFFWPAASGSVAILVVAAIFSTALAAVYGYIRTRQGLLAAFVCQATANFMLLFLPALFIPAP